MSFLFSELCISVNDAGMSTVMSIIDMTVTLDIANCLR